MRPYQYYLPPLPIYHTRAPLDFFFSYWEITWAAASPICVDADNTRSIQPCPEIGLTCVQLKSVWVPSHNRRWTRQTQKCIGESSHRGKLWLDKQTRTASMQWCGQQQVIIFDFVADLDFEWKQSIWFIYLNSWNQIKNAIKSFDLTI